jgi:hypothetical protein
MNCQHTAIRPVPPSRPLRMVGIAAGIGGLTILACILPLPPEGAPTPGPGSPPVDREIVSYPFDIEPIFSKHCAVCHRTHGLSDQFGVPLQLKFGRARMDLINQPSSLDPRLTLVIPGDAENSFLYQKVAFDLPPRGLRMPFLTDPLSDVEIDLIRRWIEQGAQ